MATFFLKIMILSIAGINEHYSYDLNALDGSVGSKVNLSLIKISLYSFKIITKVLFIAAASVIIFNIDMHVRGLGKLCFFWLCTISFS